LAVQVVGSYLHLIWSFSDSRHSQYYSFNVQCHCQGRPGACFTKQQVLSWQVKILFRMTLMTGVCFTEQQVTS